MIDFSDVKDAERVFRLFIEISAVPRASGNTEPISDFLVKFANGHGLEYFKDDCNNVIIKKSASAGYGNRGAVILQGHSDIVAERESGCISDPERDGVKVCRDGDFLYADKTTLGADNGIAIAYILAILENDGIPHPPIEALITSDEEIGLIGAAHLDASHLSGRTLINLDSEDEGIFTVGCAGGIRADITLCGKSSKPDGHAYRIRVSGLRGGHSGTEINKGGANALKLLAEILRPLRTPLIYYINGGSKDNAIAHSAEALVALTNDDVRRIFESVNSVKERYAKAESELSISCTAEDTASDAFDRSDSAAIISLINELPFGVVKMSEDIEGLPELSVNIGTALTSGDKITVGCSLRSSDSESKYKLLTDIKSIAAEHGATVEVYGDYPGWKYEKNSHIRNIMCEEFFKMYGKNAAVEAIHAGLECGILSDKIKGLDCISIGPNISDAHTTKERLSVSSAARVWQFLKNVLKNM